MPPAIKKIPNLTLNKAAFKGNEQLFNELSRTTSNISQALLDRERGQALDGTYNVKAYGAKGDGVTNDVVAIQAAIDAAIAGGGGLVFVPPGTYIVGRGATFASDSSALHLGSNVTLAGAGSGFTTIKASDTGAGDHDIMHTIVAQEGHAFTNIGLQGFTVDGDTANRPKVGRTAINIYLQEVTGIIMEDVNSINAVGSGFWTIRCSKFVAGTLRSDQSTGDCFHMVDTNYVVIGKLLLSGTGDDGFAIEAKAADVHDISVGELIVSVPVTTASAGRGVFLFSVPADAGAARSLYNISINNAVAYSCKNQACVLVDADFYNININLTEYDSGGTLYLSPGGTYVGNVRNCTFNIRSWAPTNADSTIAAVYANNPNGVIEYNRLDLQLRNPSDGYAAVDVAGDSWYINAQIDYDPAGTKTAQSYGIKLRGKDNEVHANIDGADTNIYLPNGSTYNTIYLGRLQNAVTKDMVLDAGADNNQIVGWLAANTKTDNGIGNRFY